MKQTLIYYSVVGDPRFIEMAALSAKSLLNCMNREQRESYKIALVTSNEFFQANEYALQNTPFEHFIFTCNGIEPQDAIFWKSAFKLTIGVLEEHIDRYDNFIYIDSDTIWASFPNFNTWIHREGNDSILMCSEDGYTMGSDFFGAHLLNDEEFEKFVNYDGLNGGFFAFNKESFDWIKGCLTFFGSRRWEMNEVHEQPYINVFLRSNDYKVVDTRFHYPELIKNLPIGSSATEYEGYCVYHYLGGVGNFERKYAAMKEDYSKLHK